MKKFFKVVVALLAAITVASVVAPAATTHAATSVDIDASAAIAIDADSGKIMYAKNADQSLPVASMSKLLTVYLLRQAIKQGKVKWTDTISPSKSMAALSQNRDLSNVPLRTDAKYTVKELYQATLIYSADAAAMMLGDVVAGNQTKFVKMMNTQLQDWGIKDATIVNANGLNNSDLGSNMVAGTGKDAENKMSAKDMAILARNLLKDYPDVLKTTSITKATFRKGTNDATDMDNWDWMLPGLVASYSKLKVDGLKTGTSDAAGDCFTGTVKINGMRMITVVLHANGSGTTKRFVQTAKLMSYVVHNWQTANLVKKGESVKDHSTATVDKGKDKTVAISTSKVLKTVVPTGTTSADVTKTYTSKKLSAPVKKGATAGTLNVKVKGDSLGYVDGNSGRVAVTTKTADAKAGFFRLLFRGIGEFFSNLF
ncbi:D-alanyl-D-alanine carboxypeptidase family protein [Lacticaseibacillus pantheris]|uniref:D-alanyl-D-alanine carboxypeptidase family protein n=1 Tax=Lacticaseibacillus pantheris TaxID=171523 RepID=UPI002659EA29|nr:D-alanyl-D-alanine carboxypeptidase family protein [Lacticaseibacillus pantheris]WKF85156.1 D-alanyl-D-alanine carboxypeptidase family protein [Lacticaseibacillus pantheris]